MFMLKILFILVISTNVIVANNCDPNKVTEYKCRDKYCKTDQESDKFLSLSSKKQVSVVGFKEDKFMVKKGSGFDIINKNQLKVIKFSNKGWDYLVKVDEISHKICDVVPQNNENTSKPYLNESLNPMESNGNVVNLTEKSSMNNSKNEVHNFVDISSGIKKNDEHEIIENQNITINISDSLANESKSDDVPSFTPMENQKSIPENSDDVLEQGNDFDYESEVNSTIDYENLSSNDGFINDPSIGNTIQSIKTTVSSELNDTGDKIKLPKTSEPSKDDEKCLVDNCANTLETKIEKKVDMNVSEMNSVDSGISSYSKEDENSIFTQNKTSEIPENIMKVEQFSSPQINSLNDQLDTITEEESNNKTVTHVNLSINDNNLLNHVEKLPSTENKMRNPNEIPKIHKKETINMPNELNNPPHSNSYYDINQKTDDDLTINNENLSNVDSFINIDVRDENLQNDLTMDKTAVQGSISDEVTRAPLPNNIQCEPGAECSNLAVSTHTHIYPENSDLNNENSLNVDSYVNIDVKNENLQNDPSMDKTVVEGSITDEVTRAPLPNNIQCEPGAECSNLAASMNTNTYTKNSADPILISDKRKESFISSFGHPEGCTGTACLPLINNNEQSSNANLNEPIDLSLNQNSILENLETNSESLKNEIDNLKNEQLIHTADEWNFMYYVEQWLTSPTMNTVNIIMGIFNYSNTFNDQQIDIFSTEDFSGDENISHRKQMNDNLKIYFITSAVITLLFFIGYCKYQKGSYENHLLTLLAVKEQSLLILEQELCAMKDKNTENTTIVHNENSDYEKLKNKLEKSEDIINSQTITIENLEQEISELTEAADKMHELFKSALESSEKHKSYASLTKTKLDESENMIIALKEKNVELNRDIEKKCEAIKNLHSINDELVQKNNKMIDENEKTVCHLKQILDNKMKLQKENDELQYELNKVNSALIMAQNEATLSKEALHDFISKKINAAEAKELLFSVKSLAELNSTKKMCEKYQIKIEELIQLNQQSRDHNDTLNSEIANLKASYTKLKKSKDELETKLNVLSNFFKDQEKEYQRQINENASLYKNEIGESTNLFKQIELLNQEIANYKSVNQSLKNEISDQEASFKKQLLAADKKANDNWIAFRQAERKFKELEIETAQLRNKLTMSDKKLENGTRSIDSSKDFEDELLDIPLPTVSPDFTLLDFEPPPPIFPTSHTSTDQRLPPLGALGQGPPSPVPLLRRQNRSISSISPSPPAPLLRSSAFRPLPQKNYYKD